jgi:LysM repeat protein
MKIKQIATAALLPAAIVGLGLSTSAAAVAASAQQAGHDRARNAGQDGARHAGQDGSRHAGRGTARQRRHSAADQWVTVRAGDTLSGIAAAHHMSWQAIYATPPNPRLLQNPDLIFAGERLRIPADPRLRAAEFTARYAAQVQQEQAAPEQPAAPQASQQQATYQAPADQAQQAGAGQQPVTAGESAFEQCVAWRESSDTPTDPDGLFGILPSVWQSLGYSGTAGGAPVSVQQQAFSQLYAEYGTQPWAPSDGC